MACGCKKKTEQPVQQQPAQQATIKLTETKPPVVTQTIENIIDKINNINKSS